MPTGPTPGSGLLVVSALLVAGLSTACEPGSQEPEDVVVRDSAGVRIVESHRPVWVDGEGWRVDPEPRVVIGKLDGPPEYEFGNLEGVLRLPDGRIVTSETTSRQLRFFDEDGRFLHAVGGEGEGPGEFTWMWRPELHLGDSIWVFDYRLRRISVFDGEGRLGRTVSLPDFPLGYWPRAWGRNGHFLIYDAGRPGGEPVTPEVVWDSTTFVLFRGPDLPADTLGRFPLREVMGRRPEGPRTYFFPASLSHAARDGRLYLGWSDRFEVHVLDGAGQVERIVRRPLEPRVTPRELVEGVRSRRIDALGADPGHPSSPEAVRRLEEAVHRETLPFFSRILVDSEACLWVQEYAPPSMEPSNGWNVFDPEGRWLGRVETPPGLQVQQIGRNFALGIRKDDLGVQYIHLHPLEGR